jgi:hypothetical protein
MPITPIIIPLIVAGVTLGSLLASQTRKISKKKLLTASIVSGLFNTANAYLVYTLAPPTFTRGTYTGGGTFTGGGAFTGGGGFRAAAGAGGENSFLLSSFITGFLIVLAIVVVALAYVRFRGGKSEEAIETDQTETDLTEADLTEEKKLEET